LRLELLDRDVFFTAVLLVDPPGGRRSAEPDDFRVFVFAELALRRLLLDFATRLVAITCFHDNRDRVSRRSDDRPRQDSSSSHPGTAFSFHQKGGEPLTACHAKTSAKVSVADCGLLPGRPAGLLRDTSCIARLKVSCTARCDSCQAASSEKPWPAQSTAIVAAFGVSRGHAPPAKVAPLRKPTLSCRRPDIHNSGHLNLLRRPLLPNGSWHRLCGTPTWPDRAERWSAKRD